MKLRHAVPLSEYRTLSSEMELFKHKNADLIDRSSTMT